MKYPSSNILSQIEFLNIVSKRAGFTQEDTRVLFTAIQQVFTECIQTKTEVYLGDLGHLHYFTTKERTLPNVQDGQLITRPESIRPIITLPLAIKQIVRGRVGELPWKKRQRKNIIKKEFGDMNE